MSGSINGRLESDSLANTVASMRLRYYVTQSPKRLFFAGVAVSRAKSPRHR